MFIKHYPPVVMLRKHLIWAGIIFLFLMISLILYNLYEAASKPMIHASQKESIRMLTSLEDVAWYKKNIPFSMKVPDADLSEKKKSFLVKKKKQYHALKQRADDVLSSLRNEYSSEMQSAMRSPITANQLIAENESDDLLTLIEDKLSMLNNKKLGDKDHSLLKRIGNKLLVEKENSQASNASVLTADHFNTIQQGTIIPAILISGLNANLPGQVIAQVRSNVYDSLTGNYLLIPQGAKLIGAYESNLAYGQERLFVFWQRILLPSGQSIILNRMPGVTVNGYAGMQDQVNHHYWKTFGSVALMSVLHAGMQAAYPSNLSRKNERMIASLLAKDFAAASTMLLKKNLGIQPTLEIRPGFLFNVMVTQDLSI